MNLYALLIGINEYALNPLHQCINDVHKFETYLQTINKLYDNISIQKLIDKNATKATIVSTIETFLMNVDDDDVVFIYYSGHGALEEASDRFSDAHTNLIECIVCYDNEQSEKSNFLLADKEVRFLLSKFINKPHIVTVFDCCHSGDIVRSFTPENDPDSRQRKITNIFPSRPYSEFIFSKEINEEALKSQKTSSLISYKNTVHISACLSSESSWEDSKGGVFTRYLLQLIKTKSNQIRYLDIAKWSKIGLKEITNKKQTPSISIQGKGKIDQYSPWLNLFPNQPLQQRGQLVFNTKSGWYYDKGRLYGVTLGSEIMVSITSQKSFKTTVTKVNLEDSLVKDPMETGIQLDYTKSYPVVTETMYSPLYLCFYNKDQDTLKEKYILSIITNVPEIILVSSEKASYAVTIFNQTVYISLSNDPYRPLATQIDILNTSNDRVEKQLTSQLFALVKWNYYDTLINPDSEFLSPQIKVEIRLNEHMNWEDITDMHYQLIPFQNKKTNDTEYYQQYQLRVTNISTKTLFITALVLSSDIGISGAPFDNLSKRISPNEFVLFYEHYPSAYTGWSLDTYKEIYNWKYDWLQYKFIINTQEDITTSIPNMLQPGLPHPQIKDALRGHGPIVDFTPKKVNWEVYTTSLRLVNPSYNRFSEKLLKDKNWYTSNKSIAPFIDILYPKAKPPDLQTNSS